MESAREDSGREPVERLPVGRFLHPRHWPTWLGLGLLRATGALPYAAQRRLAGVLGGLFHRLAGRRRHIAETNLRLAFPELDASRREELIREVFDSAAMALLETGVSWWADDERLRPLYRVKGVENLEAARRLGKGVILLGGHYTTLEISGRFAALHMPDVCPVYKPAHNPLFEAVMSRARRRHYHRLLPTKDMRALVRALRRKEVVWYAPDQDFGLRASVFAPFMGVATATLTMTARLARASGAPVLPFYSERLPGTAGYLIRFGEILDGFPSGDDETDAARVNAAIEAQVRRTPAQYLWLHRRFKTRPPGEKPVY